MKCIRTGVIACIMLAVMIAGCSQGPRRKRQAKKTTGQEPVSVDVQPAESATSPGIAIAAAPSELLSYLPPNLTCAMGLRPAQLGTTPHADMVRLQLRTVVELLSGIGVPFNHVDELCFGANRENNELLIAARTGGLNAPAIRQKLGAAAKGEIIGNLEVLPLANSQINQNALCLLDGRTLLLGRKSTVEAALKSPAPGEIRQARQAMPESTFIWFIGDKHSLPGIVRSATGGYAGRLLDHVKAATTVTVSVAHRSSDIQLSFNFPSDTHASMAKGDVEGDKEIFKVANVKPAAPPKPEKTEKKEREVAKLSDRAKRLYSLSDRLSALEDLSKPTQQSTRLNLSIRIDGRLLSLESAAAHATAANPRGDGLLPSPLAMLGPALEKARAKGELRGTRKPDPKDVFEGHSWMCELLPYLGRQALYDRMAFEKSWLEGEKNIETAFEVVGEFLNPAEPKARWSGFPFHGMALSHFVGMSGVERGRNVVAAELPRTDPNAGVFGFDRVAKPEEITDGVSNTIMMIGAGPVMGPWIAGGGATVRGARPTAFDPSTGFGSVGLKQRGAVALMADGSVRVVHADVDRKVFEAMCTIHGGETVDLKALAEK